MRKKKGLSLVEIILSIAMLSVLSVFIVQMFVTASHLNKEAELLDVSVAMTTTIMEHLKAIDDYDDITKREVFRHANLSKDQQRLEIVMYYDAHWRHVDKALADYKIVATILDSVSIHVESYVFESDVERLLYDIQLQKNDK